MKKILLMIFLVLSFLSLSSCIEKIKEGEIKEQEVFLGLSKIESEKDALIITEKGCFSRNFSFYFFPLIDEKLIEDDKELNYYKDQVVYYGTKVHYYEDKVFIIAEYKKGNYIVGWYDLNNYLLQAEYVDIFNKFEELRIYYKNINIYYMDDNYCVICINNLNYNSYTEYIVYEYNQGIVKVFNEKLKVLEYINKYDIVPISTRLYSYKGVTYHFSIVDKPFFGHGNYNDNSIRIYNEDESYDYTLTYNTFLENEKMWAIDQLIGDDKHNMYYQYYYQEEELYLYFYDRGFAALDSLLPQIIFQFDVETKKLTYIGYLPEENIFSKIVYIK